MTKYGNVYPDVLSGANTSSVFYKRAVRMERVRPVFLVISSINHLSVLWNVSLIAVGSHTLTLHAATSIYSGYFDFIAFSVRCLAA